MSNKGLKSKIHRRSYSSTIKKTSHPTKKWEEDLKRHFSKDIHVGNKRRKQCPTSPITKNCKPKYSKRSPHTGQNSNEHKDMK